MFFGIRRRGKSFEVPSSTGSLNLNFLGRNRPITSTSTSYSTITFDSASGSSYNTISGISSQNYWYILGVASRDSNGEANPNWNTSATIAGTTAKRIGQYPASGGNSFTTICFYAYQTTSTSHQGTITLGRTHEGGVAVVLYEFEYTGSDLAYYNNQTYNTSTGSGSMALSNKHPERLWSDHPTQTARTWSGTRLHTLWANGTSNSIAATPTNTSSGVASWTQNYYIEHGTNEWARFYSGEWTGSSSFYSQASSGGGTSPSGQYNGINLLTIGDV